MHKHTKTTLSHLEGLFAELGIQIRYEKGNFQSGYCVVSGKNMIIVNRFFDVDARINTLMDIFDNESIPREDLRPESIEWIHKLRKSLAKPV